jgi:hypothetical protein
MTTVTNNITTRSNVDNFVKTDAKTDDFAAAMLFKDSSGQVADATADSKIDRKKSLPKPRNNADFLSELFGKDKVKKDPVTTDPVTTDPITRDPITRDPVTRDPVTTDPIISDHIVAPDADTKIEAGEAEDVLFFNEGDVVFDDWDDTTFVTTGDPIDEDGAVLDDHEGVDIHFETTTSDNQTGTESYDRRDTKDRETNGNPVFDVQLRNEGEATNLENHDRVPTGPVYPNIGASLTGPRGQISWGELHDKVVRTAGDGWLEMEELTSLGLSNAAARAILAGEQAISAGLLMDTFAGEARLRGGMPVSITDQGIDEALSALIHADGPLRGNFDAFAPDGFIGKEDFIELATEAAAYLNEPAPSRRSIGQLFDEIAGGDRRLSEFEFNNMIAGTNADGSFEFEDAGLSILEQLAVQGPPLTDRWFEPEPDRSTRRNDHGRPAYTFGSSNAIRLGEFRQAANNAMDWTGEFVSPRRVNEAFQTISSWDGRLGISQTESRWAFGSNPSAWDIIDGIRSNSTPSWTSRWQEPRPVSTSWWKSSW